MPLMPLMPLLPLGAVWFDATVLPCHNICLYEDLFLIKWQHQIESNRCCRHSASASVSSSSPALHCDCAISESASTHPPCLPPPAPPPARFPVSPSTGDKFTWFKVAPATPLWCANPRMRCGHVMESTVTTTTTTAPVAALHVPPELGLAY